MAQASTYTPEVGAQICERLATGKSLLATCKEIGASYEAAKRWESDIPEHATKSARAREIGCHALADQCIDIADESHNDTVQRGEFDVTNNEAIQRSRLRIDTRMRLIGKWLPKVYGDRVEQHISGTLTTRAATMSDDELAQIAAGADK